MKNTGKAAREDYIMQTLSKDGNVKINFLEKKQKWIFFPLNGLDSKIYESRNTS